LANDRDEEVVFGKPNPFMMIRTDIALISGDLGFSALLFQSSRHLPWIILRERTGSGPVARDRLLLVNPADRPADGGVACASHVPDSSTSTDEGA
jgi:hypothetical protein